MNKCGRLDIHHDRRFVFSAPSAMSTIRASVVALLARAQSRCAEIIGTDNLHFHNTSNVLLKFCILHQA